MSGVRRLSDQDVRGLRTAAQHLHRPHRRAPVELVRHLCGVQAQVLSAAALALRARIEGLTAGRVDRARLRERSIVLAWAMRGTLHLITADDYGWLIPLLMRPRIGNAHRRLKQEGVPADQAEKAVRLIDRMLDREGPLSRPEIAERLARHGIRTEGQAIAYLVWLAAAQGGICYGPDRGPERCFARVGDWLGQPAAIDPERALLELAARFLTAHGPAEPADLAFWAGIGLGDAKRAWRGIEDRLATVETGRGTRWTLRSQPAQSPRGVVRLLPAFDEYFLGWKDRTFAVSAGHWARINRGGGWLHPVVLADGRAVGTWSAETGSTSIRLEIRPFAALATTVRRGARSDADDLARFLGTHVEVEGIGSPRRGEMSPGTP